MTRFAFIFLDATGILGGSHAYGATWWAAREQLRRDLAARADNAKAWRFFSPEEDSLSIAWGREHPGALGWLNPPFADIAPWAAKCALETDDTGLRVLLLTPASVGATWFAEHVHRKAMVLALRPRLTFEGCDAPYPKDCMLSCFGFGVAGFDVWRWR